MTKKNLTQLISINKQNSINFIKQISCRVVSYRGQAPSLSPPAPPSISPKAILLRDFQPLQRMAFNSANAKIFPNS